MSIYSIGEAVSHILRSQYKKVEESATDCDVLMHHPFNIAYWNWAENPTFT